jgi:DNA/RNA-binding domain of Phe-tRNA-synthetase-like protein
METVLTVNLWLRRRKQLPLGCRILEEVTASRKTQAVQQAVLAVLGDGIRHSQSVEKVTDGSHVSEWRQNTRIDRQTLDKGKPQEIEKPVERWEYVACKLTR